MVFFVCEGCNETVKKNQVDKHAQRCRVCKAVTCVDCSVTFYGNDYAAHITCVSEAEKYEKTLYKGPKVKANPQDAWMLMVNEAVSNVSSAPPAIQTHLKRLNELTNIPRHEKKFVNFVKNSLHLYNDTLIGDIWKFLESYKTPHPSTKPTTPSAAPSSSSTSKSKLIEVPILAGSATSNKEETDPGPLNDEEPSVESSVEKKKRKKEEKKRKRYQEAVAEETVFTTTDDTLEAGKDETDDGGELKKKKKEKKDKKNKKDRKEKEDDE